MNLLNATATTTIPESYGFTPQAGWELFGLLVSAIVAVIVTFAIQNLMDRPKIRGGIFGVVISEWINVPARIHKTSFWPYVYLTNQHDNTIWPLDYEFEADFGEGYARLKREYFDVSRDIQESMSFNIAGNAVAVRNLGRHLLTKIAKPIAYGDFLHGFVMFSGDITLYEQRRTVKKAKFTCIDVFKKRHVIEVEEKDFVNINLLLEILQVSEE